MDRRTRCRDDRLRQSAGRGARKGCACRYEEAQARGRAAADLEGSRQVAVARRRGQDGAIELGLEDGRPPGGSRHSQARRHPKEGLSAVGRHNSGHARSDADQSGNAHTRLGAEGLWDAPIVTEVEPLTTFYPAEAYHQDYFANNPQQPYCQVVVAPKVAKARKVFLAKLKR